ncbi:MAG TPA: (d)CMP kinase [Bacteroidia bacterium]|jgi:cytidylate kinase|nr:(d)CMP kinase [Bacteroidia bacterium]
MRKIIIAIDGYSSCGKSTISRSLANALGYAYIDTGAMYRAVTYYCLKKGIITDGHIDGKKVAKELPNIHITFQHSPKVGKSETYLNGKNIEEDIRTMEVSNVVSAVSAIHEVRELLVDQQRKMAQDGGVVMDGRDIGTTVFPHAELKIFITADIDVRTERRKLELKAKGIKVTDEEVRENLLKRDKEDSRRKESPLKQAEDALVLDTTHLTREQQLERVIHWARERMKD